MNDLKRRTVRTRTWLAWAGTTEELCSIGQAVERLSDTATIRDTGGSSADSVFDGDKVTFETTVTHGDDSVTGRLDAVLSELDRRTATSITFRISPRIGDDRLWLDLNWLRNSFAVHLVISSPDFGWASQALGSLSEEIDKGRPRWAWVRSSWGKALVYEFTALMFGGGVWLLIAPFVDSIWWRIIMVSILAIPAGVIAISDPIYRWLFPGVELIVPGGTSTGSRRIAYVGSLVLTVVVGVLVNFMTAGVPPQTP